MFAPQNKWSTSNSWMILRSYASPKTDTLRNPNLSTSNLGGMSAVEQQQQQQTWVQIGGSKGSCTADLQHAGKDQSAKHGP